VKARPALLVFALAFAVGAIVAVHALRPQAAAEAASATADSVVAENEVAAPAGDDDDDGGDEAGGEPTWPADAGTPEQVLYAQHHLLDEALARVTPRVPGKTNLYLIAFAGDGEEDVFRNESEYAERLFVERYDGVGHTLVLVNNPATLNQRPLATLSNLQAAVEGIASRMDPDEDVMAVFLTSHGSAEHELYVALDPLPLDQIGPDDLAGVFAQTAVRNKVVIISACYSGGFIDALRSPQTMVITAARADRPSFGCGTQSTITDFGRAFFVNGLNDTDSFSAAFAEARRLIDGWETKAGEQHSEPQIATAAPIEARLKAWRDGIHLGPRVPFAPVRAHPSAEASTLTAGR
jgi:hypothetical protein